MPAMSGAWRSLDAAVRPIPVAANPKPFACKREVICRTAALRAGTGRPIWRGDFLIDEDEMSAFDDRERAYEAKYARDQEVQFRITARRNRLVGEWAAERMGLTPEETDAYAKAVVQADFEEAGDEDVIRKLAGDLTAAQIEISDAEIRAALNEKTAEARRQFIDSQN
jgi:hypothetical protein